MPFVTNSSSEFYKTYCLYREYLGYTKPYSYARWMRLDEKYKCAALYCQFYDQITLAWYKSKAPWVTECEAVEELHKYLEKNVKLIEQDKKRFTPNYIYRVSWNCLDCLRGWKNWEPKSKFRYYNEVNNIVTDDSGKEISIFDFINSDKTVEDEFRDSQMEDAIASADEDVKVYVDYVLGGMSEYDILRYMKSHGIIDCPIRNLDSRKDAIDEVDRKYVVKLRELVVTCGVL